MRRSACSAGDMGIYLLITGHVFHARISPLEEMRWLEVTNVRIFVTGHEKLAVGIPLPDIEPLVRISRVGVAETLNSSILAHLP